MSWPVSQDYNEAIQSPESSFADPELKKGEVVCNALGIPLPRSGNFADVYEFRCANGTRWAIKCFTRQVAGLRERYQEISRALQEAKLPFTVEFTYQQEGMRIRGLWYPILKMQWVAGLTFNDFVRQNLDKPAMLDGLLGIWGRMSQRLRASGIAHADLQHGNVLLVPGSTAGSLAVKLIDYDGMFVPALAGKPSGEVGHPSYQHPQRVREGIYSAEVDRFPLLLIAASLRCLRVGGRSLWERHDNGDNLLFREADLKSPATSKLFAELEGLGDAKAKTLVGLVRRALAGPAGGVPLLEEVLPDLASASVSAPPPAKPYRPAPAALPATAVVGFQAPVATLVPPRVQTAANQATASAGAAVVESLDFEKPTSPGERRSSKKAALPVLWILVCGAVAAAMLLLVVGTVGAVVLLSGRSKQTVPDKGQQASVKPQNKEVRPIAPAVPDNMNTGRKDPKPIKEPGSDPSEDPMTPPVIVPPVESVNEHKDPVRADDGRFRLHNTFNLTAPTETVAIFPNGKFVVSFNNKGGMLTVWNVDKDIGRTLPTSLTTIKGLAVLPDNRTILFGADDNKAHKLTLTVQHDGYTPITDFGDSPDDNINWALKTLEVTPDGKYIWSVSDNRILAWHADDGKIRFRIRTGTVMGTPQSVSPAGNGGDCGNKLQQPEERDLEIEPGPPVPGVFVEHLGHFLRWQACGGGKHTIRRSDRA